MSKSKTAWLPVTIVRETPKAIMVTDSKTQAWVPKSQIIDSSDDLTPGVELEIEIPIWLAEDKGFA